MKPWNSEANDLFVQALDVESGPERQAFLDRSCKANEDLRRRVEELLAANERAGDFLESPALGLSGTSTAPTHESRQEGSGTVIGPYKLLQHIGEGGFGSVFMAEQDRPVRRRVALKIIKLGMDTKEVVARFEAERQALALMDHPNIARVLDAGATESGRPYFVMELVRGDPVTTYCDQRRLDLRERLELFKQICHAVQHAHQKGIIHRDLKPTNVLVTMADGRPIPKVIDFGIAKATGDRLTDKTLFTDFRQLIGTPAYMSPEQADSSAIDIDTRSDIYSLGVLLYELMTGTTPFEAARLRSAGYDEVRRIIREEEPEKPSTRLHTLQHRLPGGNGHAARRAEKGQGSSARRTPDTSPKPNGAGSSAFDIGKQRRTDPASLSRLLRGDLDWIVMRCLEKDRARRYETANGLASDIQRHLNNEPVLAGPPGAAYRFRKFARRNRGVLITVSVIAASVLVGLTLATIGFIDSSRQRDQAEANFEKARDAVDRMLTRVAEELENEPHMQPVRRGLLEDALEFYESFLRERSDDPSVSLETGRACARVGYISLLLGHDLRGEEAYRKAIDILEPLVEVSEDSAYVEALADACSELGYFFWSTGKVNEAEPILRRALALRREVLSGRPDDPDNRNDLARALNDLGLALHDKGATEEAHELRLECRAIMELLVEAWPKEAAYRFELARVQNNLATYYSRKGRPKERDAQFRIAIGLMEELVAEHPENPRYRDVLAHYLSNLAYTLGGFSREEKGMRERALDLSRKLVEEFPSVPKYRFNLARRQIALSWELANARRVEEALVLQREALENFQRLVADLPSTPRQRLTFIDSLRRLIENFPGDSEYAAMSKGLFQQVLRLYKQSLANTEGYWTNMSTYRLAEVYGQFAVFLAERGEHDEVSALMAEGIAHFEELLARSNDDTGRPFERALGYLMIRSAEFLEDDASHAMFERALGILEPLAADSSNLANQETQRERIWDLKVLSEAYYRFSHHLAEDNQYERALAIDRQNVALAEEFARLDDQEAGLVWDTCVKLAERLHCAGRSAESMDAARKALAAAEQLMANKPGGHEYRRVIMSLSYLARELREIGETAKAKELSDRIDRFGNGSSSTPEAEANHLNDVAWRLGVDYEPYSRFPKHAVGLAERAVQLVPEDENLWNTLGIVRYRAGDWAGTIEALLKSNELGWVRPDNCFFLAMAYWQLSDREIAEAWYDRAVKWMAENDGWADLRRWRAEAAELMKLLGVERQTSVLNDIRETPKHTYLILDDEPLDRAEAKGPVQVAVEDEGSQSRVIVTGDSQEAICPYELTLQTPSKSKTIIGSIIPTVWDIQVFGFQTDPRDNVEAWHREAAQRHVDTQVRQLFLKYGPKGPSELFDFDPRVAEADIPADNFGTIATTKVTIPSGVWQLRAVSDDGVRVWVDGALLIDVWQGQPARLSTATLPMFETRQVEIRVEHFDLGLDAHLRFDIWPTDKSLLPFAWEVGTEAEAAGDLESFASLRDVIEQVIDAEPDSATAPNDLAWFLSTCPFPELRDLSRAVQLAERAVELEPSNWSFWGTLGAARYRAGDWRGAIEALNRSLELEDELDYPGNCYFLAMAHWQLGEGQEAGRYLEEANRGMDLYMADDAELLRFRAEAARLLGRVPIQEIPGGFAGENVQPKRVYRILDTEIPDSVEVIGEVRAQIVNDGAQPQIEVWAEACGDVCTFTLTVQNASRRSTIYSAIFAADWEVRHFGYTADPREDLAAWHREADDYISYRTSRLYLPFEVNGPSQLVEFEPVVAEAKLPADHFGTIATTRVNVPDGRWEIRTVSDDGVRVWVDDELLIDNWTWHVPMTNTAELQFEHPRTIQIRVEHFELDGWATLSFDLVPLPPLELTDQETQRQPR